MSQDSWTIRKGKTRISWVWKMRNDHYGVRKKVRKHGKWGIKQDSTAWKFRTQKSDGIIYSDFENKFRVLPGVHCIHTIYRFEVQKVKSPTLQTVITSLFQLWFAHYLKCWIPDFLFEMIYSLPKIDFKKCSKFASNLNYMLLSDFAFQISI